MIQLTINEVEITCSYDYFNGDIHFWKKNVACQLRMFTLSVGRLVMSHFRLTYSSNVDTSFSEACHMSGLDFEYPWVRIFYLDFQFLLIRFDSN